VAQPDRPLGCASLLASTTKAMKFLHRHKHAFVLCHGFLCALSFSVSAQARGGPEAFGYAILFFALVNVVFYGVVVLSCISGIIVWRRKRKFAIFLILLALLPFLHYSVEVLRSQFEPDRRRQQLASLMQQRVVSAIPPRSIEMMNWFANKEVEALVAVGVVDEVQSFNRYTNKTLVYKLHEGPECIDFETSGAPQAELRRAVLARHAFQRCVKQTEREGPANAPIQLFAGDYAPSRYTGPACLGGGNNPLELRWSPRLGGALLAFSESTSFIAHAFPPRMPGHHQIWACESLHADSPEYYWQDPFRLVSTALGFKNVDDFPKSSKPEIVPKALQLLTTKLDAQHAHDNILALLGQWPSTPAIDSILTDPRVIKRSAYILRKAAAILSEPSMDERGKRFYPRLSTHKPSLLKICSQRAGQYDTVESCARLSSVAKGTGAHPNR